MLLHSFVETSDGEIAVTLEDAAAATLSVGRPADIGRFGVGSGALAIFGGVQVALYRERLDRFS